MMVSLSFTISKPSLQFYNPNLAPFLAKPLSFSRHFSKYYWKQSKFLNSSNSTFWANNLGFIKKRSKTKHSKRLFQKLYKSAYHIRAFVPQKDLPVDNEALESKKLEEKIFVDPKMDTKTDKGSFKWEHNWYPVALLEDLDPKKPTPFQLLGLELVLWLDKDKIWRAFSDLCPHRLAPLSEGRIDENGFLQCSYHGWSFTGEGKCASIPQASDHGPEAKATLSPRACAKMYPTVVSQGLLFIWPDTNTWELAEKTDPQRLPDDFDDPGWANITIQRDLMYGYDTLMENVSDPSHIHFAHHKVTGLRESAKPMPFKLTQSGPWGFEGCTEPSIEPKFYSKFIAPCYMINKIELDSPPFFQKDKWVIWICSFNIPMAQGKTRSIVCSARNFFQWLAPGKQWWQFVPRWYEHLKSNLVYDGDMIVLQGQEKAFMKEEDDGVSLSAQYGKLTFTPTAADRLVLAFRNWLRKHGHGSPKYFSSSKASPLPSTILSKREMLDRFSQHTEKCSSCRTALSNIRRVSLVSAIASVFLFGGASIPEDVLWRAVLAAFATILALVAGFLKFGLEPKFIFQDYVHADID